MKKIIISLLISLTLSTSVLAQTYIEGKGGISIPTSSQNEVGNSGTGALAIGWDAKTLRLETEIITNDIINNKGKKGSNEFKAINTNVALAPINLGILTPYTTAGIGYATFDGSAVSKDKDNSLLFNLGAGIDLHLTNKLTLTASYRYFLTYDKIIVNDEGKLAKFQNNVLLVGVRYSF